MGRRQPDRNVTIAAPSSAELRTIIQGEEVESAQLTVQWAQSLARDLKQVKAAQIRPFFSNERQVEIIWPRETDGTPEARAAMRDLILLKPKLAYQVERKNELEALANVLTSSIDLVEGNRANFQRFVDFFEAIVASHKAEGGN